MKKKKNAFTLIELLAIIVILAIIAVITVPIILNIIENSRKGASIDSAYGYRDSIHQYYLSKSVGSTTDNVLATEVIKTVSDLETDGLTVSGDKPTEGWVQLNKGQVVDYSLKFGDYVVNYDEDTKAPIAIKGNIIDDVFIYYGFDTNNNQIETVTINPSWEFYIRQNKNTNVKEVCGIYTNGTICFNENSYDQNCDENGQNCSVNLSGTKTTELINEFKDVMTDLEGTPTGNCNTVNTPMGGMFSCSAGGSHIYCSAGPNNNGPKCYYSNGSKCQINLDGTFSCS